MKFCSQANCPRKAEARIALILDARREQPRDLKDIREIRAAVATVRFFWPGSEDTPAEVCAGCAARARAVAEAFGFQLRTEDLVLDEDEFGSQRFALLEVE